MGLSIVTPFRHHVPYLGRAFALSFGACVLVAGLGQLYASAVFGVEMTTSDATLYYEMATQRGAGATLWQLARVVNAPLPVSVWGQCYRIVGALGLGQGPWIGILFNCFLVGLSGSVLTAAAHSIFGSDDQRLRLVGTLFATCGTTWLFGALHLRDAWALLLNVTLLWVSLAMLSRPSRRNILVFLGVTLALLAVVEHVRSGTKYITWPLASIALLSLANRGRVRFVLGPLILSAFILALMSSSFTDLVSVALESAEDNRRAYASMASNAESLGASLIVNQPMPIRLVLGSGSLLVNPVPLWTNFTLSLGEYHWIKGYQGFFLVFLTPFVLVGLFLALREVVRGSKIGPAAGFLVVFVALGFLSVAATSLETRHVSQFMPGVLLLAAIPSRTAPRVRALVGKTRFVWLWTVLFLHVLWMMLAHT